MSTLKYCENLFSYHRRTTHEVKVGDVGIGGQNPVRVQSMTISDTMDTSASVQEVIQLVEAGCEIVRLTAPSMNEAKNLKEIKAALKKQGIHVPLVADIHYTPNAALVAADFVEKVRINPGNYADKKKFEVREYSDSEYAAELERIRDRFSPLVLKCKANGVAMRIGVNHGSLSDRVMNRYGDTPEGMVQSALEFIEICEAYAYKNLVVSMKSSNPQVMIQAYRLLAARMFELEMTYPLHLGVTEAGDGEDGRIKSAVGIGALLEDGIGDTIRVSLTEDAVYEVPVAKALARKYNSWNSESYTPLEAEEQLFLKSFPPFDTNRRVGRHVDVKNLSIGEGEPVRVAINLQSLEGQASAMALPVMGQKQPNADTQPEWIFSQNGKAIPYAFAQLPLVRPHTDSSDLLHFNLPMNTIDRFEMSLLTGVLNEFKNSSRPFLLECTNFQPGVLKKSAANHAFEQILKEAVNLGNGRLVIGLQVPANQLGALTGIRQVLLHIAEHKIDAPILLHYEVPINFSDWRLDAAATLGALLCDGIGDAVYISGAVTADEAVAFAYTLLQATRLRISKTEFISCPSCGRTLFNLQTTTERIKSKTDHLKGVKVAIMGCIVNGPGEMADADFGYVGAGPGKVNLFVGKDCVERNIPESEADQRLIDLIKRHGKWVDP